ncbi:MAG: hypothetical protein F6K47_11260 [Symploca sp. SIO2E6]|nr:hypothetical protein [Symploca sp. SIO2E6]
MSLNPLLLPIYIVVGKSSYWGMGGWGDGETRETREMGRWGDGEIFTLTNSQITNNQFPNNQQPTTNNQQPTTNNK